jgi:hypothetical protein
MLGDGTVAAMVQLVMLKQVIIPSALLLSLSLLGCSSDGAEDGSDAQLTIMGDSALTLIPGVETTLRVRYHDSAQLALAGEISFSIDGADASFLGATEASTDEAGEAGVSLTIAAGSAPFAVLASAPGAQSVSWTVDISAQALVIDGDYNLDSKFKMLGSNDGIAEAVTLFEEMTDDPDDPGTWLVDVLLDELDSGFVSGAVGLARPSLDGWIKSLMLQGASADYVQNANQIASQLRSLSESIGTRSELRIRPWTEDGSYRATHELLSLVATIDGVEFEKTLSGLGQPAISAQNVHIARTDSGELAIDDHEMDLPYGVMALATLEEAIIPLVEPQASSVHGLLTSFVDCQMIGASIADYIGLGSATTYDGPCNAAMSAAAAHVESTLLDMDDATPASVNLNGFASFADSNADGEVDELVRGKWYGSFLMGQQIDRALVEGESSFTGRRAR